MQLNPDGTPLRARIDYPHTEDGAKVVICSKGKAAVWFKDKKGYTVVPRKTPWIAWWRCRKSVFPRLAFEELQGRKRPARSRSKPQQPAKAGDFLKLTVTPNSEPDQQEVYKVNPTTKLAKRVTYYRRQDNQWKEVKLIEYLDYNKPIDPKVFDLELPSDVVKVNEIKRPPGLMRGNLTKEQIATKVAREFFEGLIAKDYEKAGLIYSGIPAKADEVTLWTPERFAHRRGGKTRGGAASRSTAHGRPRQGGVRRQEVDSGVRAAGPAHGQPGGDESRAGVFRSDHPQ